MYKYEKELLSHMRPTTDNELLKYGSDTFCLSQSKHLTINSFTNKVEIVKKWVCKNEGKFTLLTDSFISGEQRCCIVKIIFPSRRGDMKNKIATLYGVEE